MRWRRSLPLTALLLACSPPGSDEPLWTDPNVAAKGRLDDPDVSVAGIWRATLLSPGGELPFYLRIEERAEGLSAVVRNGEEELPLSSVERDAETVRLRFDGYDSEITASVEADGRQLRGEWRKTIPEGASKLPFSADKGDNRRFLPGRDTTLKPVAGSPEHIDGDWSLGFVEEDGSTFPGRAELEQDGERVLGTILTETGDYRYLEGSYHDGWLLLSVFDGAHAFLFRAQATSDGQLVGDFWSRDRYHATFSGERIKNNERDQRESPWKLSGITDRAGHFDFSFPNLEGNLVSDDDPRFAGKVVLVDVFGSWCPNCNDQAPLLAGWDREYRDQGLRIVGLAYEMTGEPDRDRSYVAKFRDRHGIEYPLLLAGTSDKAAASKTLPDLSEVVAFPTTIFVGRDGKVRKVYSGFAGPATGPHHERMVRDHETLIKELLAEGQDGG